MQAVPHAERMGHRLVGPLALVRSLEGEHDGALPEALAALTDSFHGSTDGVEDIEHLLCRRRPPCRACTTTLRPGCSRTRSATALPAGRFRAPWVLCPLLLSVI
jgi:hypothetical protein